MLVWRPNFSKRASGALKIFIYDLIWSRDPRTWNLEPPPPAPPTAEPGTWNLKPGTYRQKSRKKSKRNRACGTGGTWNLGTWNLYLLTRDPRNRNLGTPQGVEDKNESDMTSTTRASRRSARGCPEPQHVYQTVEDRQTDSQNFGHTNCGCIDGATVYGSRGPSFRSLHSFPLNKYSSELLELVSRNVSARERSFQMMHHSGQIPRKKQGR